MIGGGIGGTAAAYFLRQKFGRSVRIEVLERGEVGGRLATVEVEGESYEAGGSVLHPLNLHMKHFAKELGEYPQPMHGGGGGGEEGGCPSAMGWGAHSPPHTHLRPIAALPARPKSSRIMGWHGVKSRRLVADSPHCAL